MPFPAGVFEVSDEFFLFGVDGDDGVSGPLIVRDHADNMFKLGIVVFVLAPFEGLPHRLKAVPHLLEKIADRSLTDRMSFFLQLVRQTRCTFAGPAERRHRISLRYWVHEGIQIAKERLVFVDKFFCPPPGDDLTRGARGLSDDFFGG